MRIKNYCISLLFLLLSVGTAHPQENSTDISYESIANKDYVDADTVGNKIRINKRNDNIEVHFRLDKHYLDLGYRGNEASLKKFAHKIDSIGIEKIDSVVIVSQSSPEGVYEHNLWLSDNRANTMRKYLLENHPELRDLLYVHPDGESWGRLREYVKKDTKMKQSTIDKVISIIDSDINIGTKKWRMQQLPVYKYLLTTYYPRIRNSSFLIVYYNEIINIEPTVEVIEPEPVDTAKVEPDTAIVVPVIPEPEVWVPKLYLKTNAVGLGMAIANAGVEVDLARHWSVGLHTYYSAWNYFKSTIKFRTFAVQPEVRYWFSDENDGFFAGAHLGLLYYNFAFDGDYRYQDHDGTSPALGGGLSIGYRLPISKNNRWRVEFAVGAGVYDLNYDIFHNTPDVKDGLMTEESIKKTYWGIDQAAITFSYSFDLKKKGGKQ